MNVARAGVVRVAHEKVHVANYGNLIGEVAHVGREIIEIAIDARELDRALGAISQALDETLDFFLGHVFRLPRRR